MREYTAYEMNRKMEYMMQMRPVLKKRGLFSDGTADYRIPAEPEVGETVIIRFRAAVNNVDIVWLRSDERRHAMRKTETEDGFDYFSVQIPLGSVILNTTPNSTLMINALLTDSAALRSRDFFSVPA